MQEPGIEIDPDNSGHGDETLQTFRLVGARTGLILIVVTPTLLCLSLLASRLCAATDILAPPAFQDCIIYHNGFEGKPGEAEVNTEKITLVDRGSLEISDKGLLGHGLYIKDWGKPFGLRSPALSPHRPLTLSFWWALPYDLAIDGGYSLFSLTGKGYVGLFCRGKGEWCALQRPAGVFQVYYFQGIQNVNGIYDFDLLSHYNLKMGVWHHSAVVFRQATTVQVYTDGKLVCDVTISGREFSEADALQNLDFGGALMLDELMILNRAVEGDMISDYFKGMTQLREYEVSHQILNRGFSNANRN